MTHRQSAWTTGSVHGLLVQHVAYGRMYCLVGEIIDEWKSVWLTNRICGIYLHSTTKCSGMSNAIMSKEVSAADQRFGDFPIL